MKILIVRQFHTFKAFSGYKYGQQWSEWGNSEIIESQSSSWKTREEGVCHGKDGSQLENRICGNSSFREVTNVNQNQLLGFFEARQHCADQGILTVSSPNQELTSK